MLVMIIQPRDAGTPQHHGVSHKGRAPRSPHGGLKLYDSSPTTTTAALHTFGVCSCSSTPPTVAATAGDTSVQLAERGVCSCSSECVMDLGSCTSSTPPTVATSSTGAATAGDASLATASLTCVQLAERLRTIPGAAEWGDIVVPVFLYSEVGGADVAGYLDSDSSLLGFLQRELGIVKATASVAASIRAHLLTMPPAEPTRTTSSSAAPPDRTS